MVRAIQVERDAEGMQMALRELFEEGFVYGLQARSAEADAETAEMPERTLSPGYYKRAQYLLDLQRRIEMGIVFNSVSLSQLDVEGLEAVKSARTDFEREHPPCPRCGARQHTQYMDTCHNCQAKLRRNN